MGLNVCRYAQKLGINAFLQGFLFFIYKLHVYKNMVQNLDGVYFAIDYSTHKIRIISSQVKFPAKQYLYTPAQY